tara:strand:+ start:1582 stop:1710 length:129 start_codon:yes stop_codon:yes gene_type:complete
LLVVKVDYESEEVWEKTIKDIEEMIQMLSSVTRRAEIIEVKE